MSADEVLQMDLNNETNLVRPKVEFFSLLQHAGATKDVFTMKEVMFYLGQYIMQKQLYDQKQQHIVHCAQDALGRVLGLDSFSVKEPRILFAMVTKNLVAVKNQDPTINSSEGRGPQVDRGTQAAETQTSPPNRRRRQRSSSRSNDPGPSHSAELDEEEERKRRRSDSYSLTFDDSLSWCVIGGLGSGRDRTSSQSDVHSLSERSEVAAPSDVDSLSERSEVVAPSDVDSDNFSVEFEVESIDSDDYSEDDSALSADDQVYEVTVYEDDEDDAELTDADFWCCEKCKELNPPLPRNCQRCWTPRQDWLRDTSVNTSNAMPKKPTDQSAAKEAPGSEVEDNDGVDVPDGKRDKTPPASQDDLVSSQPPSSQEKLLSSDSQPSTSYSSSLDSQELPEVERSVSDESRLPDSCLDPCLICQSRPKNGCIVHGKTGHLMSCYVCARKLKRRNKMCPVCRMPIQQVVLTYFS